MREEEKKHGLTITNFSNVQNNKKKTTYFNKLK